MKILKYKLGVDVPARRGNQMKKRTKIASRRSSRAQKILTEGKILDSYPCDWDPVMKEVRSNASIENIVEYKYKLYFVISNGDSDTAFEYSIYPEDSVIAKKTLLKQLRRIK